jgi:hypothetical protein
MEGTMLVLPYHPALRAMITYYLFGSYRIRGATAAGVKPPWALAGSWVFLQSSFFVFYRIQPYSKYPSLKTVNPEKPNTSIFYYPGIPVPYWLFKGPCRICLI